MPELRSIDKELLGLASSLRLQSQKVGLRAKDEVARDYLSAEIACERLRDKLNLPDYEFRPPIAQNQYGKLLDQFRNHLGVTTPRKRKRILVEVEIATIAEKVDLGSQKAGFTELAKQYIHQQASSLPTEILLPALAVVVILLAKGATVFDGDSPMCLETAKQIATKVKLNTRVNFTNIVQRIWGEAEEKSLLEGLRVSTSGQTGNKPNERYEPTSMMDFQPYFLSDEAAAQYERWKFDIMERISKGLEADQQSADI